MHQPCEGHWIAEKRVLKYLKGTQSYGIKYSKVSDFHLTIYLDSILTEIKSMECLLQVIWWILDQRLSPRDHESNMFLLIPQLKPNMLQQLRPQKKSFGFGKYLKTCRRNKWLQRLSLLTTLLQFNWPSILNSMIEQNISIPNIIWFDIMLRPKPFIWHIVLLQSKS